MDIKRCSNCGSFTTSENGLCDTCANKLKYSNTILKNYFEENETYGSISSIASTTGVSPSIIQSYMIENNYLDTPTSATDEYFKGLPY